MKRSLALALLFTPWTLAAAPQTAVTPASDKPVAVVNGQTITAQQLDELYAGIGTQMRAQYEKAGGKQAFLENYVRKRLLVQEAIKTGFDKKPEVRAAMDAAREAALFDRYVADVVAPTVVPDAAVRAYYDQHPDEFKTPEKVHVRHIVIGVRNTGPTPRGPEEALQLIGRVATELHGLNATTRAANPAAMEQLRINEFAQLARKYSEDSSAAAGGDLGWVTRDQLDPAFAEAAFGLPVGVPSGIVKSSFGYHILFVEAKKPAGTQTFEEVKDSLREFLMTQHAAEVMTAVTRLTNDLRRSSKIAIYPENIK